MSYFAPPGTTWCGACRVPGRRPRLRADRTSAGGMTCSLPQHSPSPGWQGACFYPVRVRGTGARARTRSHTFHRAAAPGGQDPGQPFNLCEPCRLVGQVGERATQPVPRVQVRAQNPVQAQSSGSGSHRGPQVCEGAAGTTEKNAATEPAARADRRGNGTQDTRQA